MTSPSRRDALLALSMGASTALVACTPCGPATGEQTEGPYYPGVPEQRADITEDRSGVALTLTLTIHAVGECTPIEGAEVDLWCADAGGDYSGYDDFGTEGQDWLRGHQVTDANGEVRFDAIVPGSYPGRAVHLHVKVRATERDELTTQVYLPDDLAGAVLGEADYAAGAAQTLNGDDDFYAADTLLTADGDPTVGITASGTLVV